MCALCTRLCIVTRHLHFHVGVFVCGYLYTHICYHLRTCTCHVEALKSCRPRAHARVLPHKYIHTGLHSNVHRDRSRAPLACTLVKENGLDFFTQISAAAPLEEAQIPRVQCETFSERYHRANSRAFRGLHCHHGLRKQAAPHSERDSSIRSY